MHFSGQPGGSSALRSRSSPGSHQIRCVRAAAAPAPPRAGGAAGQQPPARGVASRSTCHGRAAAAALAALLALGSPQQQALAEAAPPAQLERSAAPAPSPGALLLDDARAAGVLRALPAPPRTAPPLPRIARQDIRRSVLPNGLRLLLLRDPQVPLVRGTLLLAGGQSASPADKVGLASIAAEVQRAGGSAVHPGDALDERLEDLAAAIEAVAGPRAVSVEFECASEDAAEVLSLVGELAAAPAFPAERLAVVKQQVLESLSHRDDVASSVARRELRKIMLGPDSLWARTPTPAGVASITDADLRAWWAEWERPDAAVLAVVGDFEADEMAAAAARALGGWAPAPGQPLAPRPVPGAGVEAAAAAAAAAAAGERSQAGGGAGVVWLVDRPGAAQASVATGEPGVSLTHPDAARLSALNSVLNSFGGALFDELRTREGLCYSVSGGWELPFDHEGAFLAAGETSQPALFLKELRRVLAAATEAPPPAERLARAKQERINSFVFNFATPAAQLQRAAAYELLGVPEGFLYNFRDSLQAVSAADVAAAAARHLHPYGQPAVVVADAAAAAPALRAAGFEVRPLALERYD
ncbi:peptidase M16 [Raphidocelis subcapitata]|uniref:Peptidase M16 n=1 Tax=Raphidocelis subcapitata TaxID=307507 RepID=A0A2V0PF16_9CHLO|nr:peptidase M16 [Raphidocelis subcapitata]|eukprot:GBF98119.1 peptidase M16 [Raphidocelis subcapitata]